MPRYVNGSSTFSYTVRSPIRLKLWKMKPISRLRTRARSDSGRSATDLPFRVYLPSVGESSRPRIDSSVDFPQPDGPAIAMYSPLRISRWIPASACVSTSSVKNTFVTPSRWISGWPAAFVMWLLSEDSMLAFRYQLASARQPHALVLVVGRHIRQDDLVAGLQALDDFDRV